MKNLFLLIVGLVMFTAQSQAQEQTQAQDTIPFELRRLAYIYDMAKSYNDPAVAKMAIYNLLSYNPQNTSLLDTLALMYFDYNQIASAALTAQDAAKINPNDLFAVELAAVCFERLGVLPKAISFYERLYTEDFDINTLYKIAFMQMQSNNFVESKTNADIILENPKSDEINLRFPKTDKETQDISMKAATYRLKGLIEEAQGNTAAAKGFYQKAIDMEPDFMIVKEELKEINEKE